MVVGMSENALSGQHNLSSLVTREISKIINLLLKHFNQ